MFIIELLMWIENHPGTAAWVQAIGTIVALFITIFIPVYSARKADRITRSRFLASVFSISNEVYECLNNAAAECQAGNEEGSLFVRSVDAVHRFRIVLAAITAIPLHQLPGYEVTQSVLELQAIMAKGQVQLDAAFKEVENHDRLVQAPLYSGAFSDLAAQARFHANIIENYIKNI